MTITKGKIRPLFLLLFVLFLVACREDNAFIKLPIAGNWSIKQADCDGADQKTWVGKTISFNQVSADSGIYKFPDTLYDSIWSKSASWKILNSTDLIRYDAYGTFTGTYQAADTTLTIRLLIPQNRSSPPSTDGLILPVVYGNWEFTFTKNN